MKRIEFINIADIYQSARDNIVSDMHTHIENVNQQKDILRIIYHHLFYNSCEVIRKKSSYIPTAIIYSLCDTSIDHFLKEFNCKEDPKRIFIFLMRALPGYSYIYDDRYGNIHELDINSGEYTEIIQDILSNRSKPTIQTAISTTKSAGLTFVHQNYLKDPSIKLLYYK